MPLTSFAESLPFAPSARERSSYELVLTPAVRAAQSVLYGWRRRLRACQGRRPARASDNQGQGPRSRGSADKCLPLVIQTRRRSRQWGVSTVSAPAADSSDRELLRLIASEDEAALRSLFERHSPWLLLRLQRRCGDPGLVAEALQDTFVAVWGSAPSFRGEGDVGAWLWGIAIRRLATRLRGRPAPVPVAAEAIHRRAPIVRSAEDELLLGVEHGRAGSALQPPACSGSAWALSH